MRCSTEPMVCFTLKERSGEEVLHPYKCSKVLIPQVRCGRIAKTQSELASKGWEYVCSLIYLPTACSTEHHLQPNGPPLGSICFRRLDLVGSLILTDSSLGPLVFYLSRLYAVAASLSDKLVGVTQNQGLDSNGKCWKRPLETA